MNIRGAHYKKFNTVKKHRVSAADFKLNLCNIIDLCREYNAMPILLASPYLDKGQDWVYSHKKYNDIIREVSFQNEVQLIDLVLFFKDREDLFIAPKNDYIHINLKANEIVAENLFDLIQDKLY
jgi:lysophospholipase L1-like esterase